MSLTFVTTIFDLVDSGEMTPASGAVILTDALAPSFTAGAPSGLLSRLNVYVLTILKQVDSRKCDRDTGCRAVCRIFELASRRDFTGLIEHTGQSVRA